MKEKKEGPAQQAKAEEQVQPTEMVISVELAQALLNYLGNRPYQEVAGLVSGMQDSKLQ